MHVALGVIALALVATAPLAQPSKPSDDTPAIFDRLERGMPTSKSDAYRVVGKVLEINPNAGTVKLQTEEGPVTTKPSQQLLRAARVGDTISVPRDNDNAPSASPRTAPNRSR